MFSRLASIRRPLLEEYLPAALELVYPRPAPPKNPARLEPPFCEKCGEPFEGRIDGTFVCTNCAGRLWSIGKARAGFLARGVVRDAIHALKYGGQWHVLPWLGQWLIEGFDRYYRHEPIDALIPVPLFPLRRRERGFNQSYELARLLARARNLPIWQALRRVRETRVQARLRRSERLRNQRHAYQLKRGFDLKDKRLLIVDDVFTTGATADACARVLRQNGAARVDVLTVARG